MISHLFSEDLGRGKTEECFVIRQIQLRRNETSTVTKLYDETFGGVSSWLSQSIFFSLALPVQDCLINRPRFVSHFPCLLDTFKSGREYCNLKRQKLRHQKRQFWKSSFPQRLALNLRIYILHGGPSTWSGLWISGL